MDKVKRILIISSDANLKNVLNFCFDGWGYEVFLQNPSVNEDIEHIKKISPDVIVIDVQSARKEQLNICRVLKDNFATAFIPIITLINKRQLRAQLLNLKQGVDDYLIKPPDPLDLRIRIEMAMRRAQHSINASSLTGLPGGRILEEVLKEKIKKDEQFSFGYVDIDNFKCFNDVRGYQRGDRVILQTAHMLTNTLKDLGGANDFVSHIGGDDFAFITNTDNYEQICRNFIQTFDRLILFHYSEDHRRQGFILSKDRSHKLKKMPLMSVSIAVVNIDSDSVLKNTVEINERIAEIKHYLKTISGSKFMADRREASAAHSTPEVNKKIKESKNYKPLGQILLDKKIISYEQLDEALNVHWKKGVVLGEVLKELNLIDDAALQQELDKQKVNFPCNINSN